MTESPEHRACRRSTSEEATAAFYARLRHREAWLRSVARTMAANAAVSAVAK